jgi:hypothetical protein
VACHGEEEPVAPAEPGTADLPPQHLKLVAQEYDLQILGVLAPPQEQSEDSPHDQGHERPHHEDPPAPEMPSNTTGLPLGTPIANKCTLQPPFHTMEPAARALKLTLQPVGVRSPDDFEGAFSAMAAGRADALQVFPNAVFLANMRRVAELALKQQLPSVGFKEWPNAGGLMTYGVDVVPMFRRAATFVDKVLKGPSRPTSRSSRPRSSS